MENKFKFIIVLVFWLIIISGFIAFKEYSKQTGTKILLKTMAVDPRDLFRGDYVILNYDISTIDQSKFEKVEKPEEYKQYNSGDKIYVVLEKNNDINDNSYVINSYSNEKPLNGLFINGKVQSSYSNQINVQYGIESYFIPQGQGKDIEEAINNGQDNVTVYVEVSVDRFGNGLVMELFLNEEKVMFK